MGIQVTQTNDTEIRLAVRSRADKKEPTCLLDLKAYKKNDSLYEANANGSEINIVFSKDGVHRTAENEGALFFIVSEEQLLPVRILRSRVSLIVRRLIKRSFTLTLNYKQ